MFKIKKIFVFVIVALALMALAACASPSADPEGSAVEVGASSDGPKAKITLVENPWPASELNVAVAKIIIEKELGNDVEIVALDENIQWDALATGDADAVLEVWPSGHGERITEYIGELKTVEDGGKLGPLGEIGWYVPTYVVDGDSSLATWEGYTDSAVGEMFASAETGSNGRFLGADPSWVQNDEAIISNLELPFQVVWAGSEEALLAEVSTSYAREEPILFYFYAPHAIFSKFDLTQVELPAYSDDCYADPAAIDCAYPADELMKILGGGLEEKDANVHAFLKNFNYGSEAQVEMLASVDSGMDIEEAAQAWVDGNESVWKAWLP